jgi:hypothetical protein
MSSATATQAKAANTLSTTFNASVFAGDPQLEQLLKTRPFGIAAPHFAQCAAI